MPLRHFNRSYWRMRRQNALPFVPYIWLSISFFEFLASVVSNWYNNTLLYIIIQYLPDAGKGSAVCRSLHCGTRYLTAVLARPTAQVPRWTGNVSGGPGSIPGRFWRTGVPSFRRCSTEPLHSGSVKYRDVVRPLHWPLHYLVRGWGLLKNKQKKYSMIFQVRKHNRSARIVAKQIRFNHQVCFKTHHEKSAVIMMGLVIGVFVVCYGMYLRCSFLLLFQTTITSSQCSRGFKLGH